MTRRCAHPGCTEKHLARGLCPHHYRATVYRQTAYGRWTPNRRVPAEPTRRRVQQLLDAGLSRHAIADLSGLNVATIGRIERGADATVFEGTVRAINGVTMPPLERMNPHALIPNVGTARRLQALSAVGWQAGKIRAELGWAQCYLTRIRSGNQPFVTVRVAIQVRDVYDRLHLIDGGGGVKSRRHAQKAGWALPLEWDDIDNPEELPSGRRVLVGQKDQAIDRREVVAAWMDDPRPEFLQAHRGHLYDTGGMTKGTAEQLAHELGCDVRTVERDKTRIRADRERDAA